MLVTLLFRKQLEEHAPERRGCQISRRQWERPHQTVTVCQQDQREPATRHRHHERRGSIFADSELPGDRLAEVSLHEPAASVRQSLAVWTRWCAPGGQDRLWPQDQAPLVERKR